MYLSFEKFMASLIVEDLHPELHSIVTSQQHKYGPSKQAALTSKIKDLAKRGEATGIENSMPKGSSRAYLKHTDPHKIVLDGNPVHINTGTKVAIRSKLDAHHDHDAHGGHSLGQLQNHAEGGDHWVNDQYRILRKNHETGEFHTNKDNGIFPPLVDHDHDNHHWTHVGHSDDVNTKQFRELTKAEGFPKGIGHRDFVDTLNRFHDNNWGRHWDAGPEKEALMDRLEEHPLVQKFIDFHGNTGAPPHDYRQIKNLGVFTHPDGSKHIVARDHGFSTEAARAYKDAFRKRADKSRYR